MKRVVVNVSDDFYETLQKIADQEVRSVPNLLFWLAQKGLANQKQYPKAG